MAYTSLGFLAFFPLAVFCCRLAPRRFQLPVLLGANYCYMLLWGTSSAAVLLGVTLLTYLAALGIGGAKRLAVRRAWLVFGLCACAGFLFLRKTIALFSPGTALVAAAGLAFYALQAAGYLVDVYRGDLPAQRNLLHYAVFVSFFPRVLSGPIGRAGEFFPQLVRPRPLSAEQARRGLLLMLWGYMEKLVIADTLAVLVDTVYRTPEQYSGSLIAAATAAFAFSLYCDFAGYSHLAIGAAQVLGFSLSPNFRRPYFAQSLSEFWRRWHISLSDWLRDYCYIPLGGSRCSRLRWALNLLLTFLVSGLWHGTGLQYLFWGALHAVYQICGRVLKPLRGRCLAALRLPHSSALLCWARRLWVFVLVDAAWLFFRAPSLGTGVRMFAKILLEPHPADLWNGALLGLGLSGTELAAVGAALLGLLSVSLLQERGVRLYAAFARLPAALRWGGCLLFTVAVLCFAVRTVGGDPAAFYYAQF